MSNSVRPHRQKPTRLPIPGILRVRTLEWVAISFSNEWKWKVKVKSLSHVWLFATPWTDCSLPGSSIHGIFQARASSTREWEIINRFSYLWWRRQWICGSLKSPISLPTLVRPWTFDLCLHPHNPMKSKARSSGSVNIMSEMDFVVQLAFLGPHFLLILGTSVFFTFLPAC